MIGEWQPSVRQLQMDGESPNSERFDDGTLGVRVRVWDVQICYCRKNNTFWGERMRTEKRGREGGHGHWRSGGRPPFSKARPKNSQTVIQPCMWFMEEPSQFSVGQTAQSLTCSILEKQHTGLDDCLRILMPCFRKRRSERRWRSNIIQRWFHALG